jgi:hypothetical protein
LARPGQPFEIERDVGALAGGDQVAAGDLDRVAAVLLVAGQDDLMSAFLSVPAACIARSAATITAIPPLSSPRPGRSPSLPLRVQRWNGESGSNTVSRWPISSSFLPRRCPCGGRRCGRRGRSRACRSTRPEAERLELGAHHLADRLDAGEVQRAAVLVDQPLSSIASVRACSVRVPPLSTRTVVLVPRPGRYRAQGANLLHRLLGMSGRIIVE